VSYGNIVKDVGALLVLTPAVADRDDLGGGAAKSQQIGGERVCAEYVSTPMRRNS
jgi:hypothetical protein